MATIRDGYQPTGQAVDLAVVRPPREPTAAVRPVCDEPIRSHQHAAQSLDDDEYLAYVAIQRAMMEIALLVKRWPRLAPAGLRDKIASRQNDLERVR